MARDYSNAQYDAANKIRVEAQRLGDGDLQKGLVIFLKMTGLDIVLVRANREGVTIVGRVPSFFNANYTTTLFEKRGGKVVDMYAHYLEWCEEHEYQPLGRNKFNRELRAYGLRLGKSTNNVLWYYGAMKNAD